MSFFEVAVLALLVVLIVLCYRVITLLHELSTRVGVSGVHLESLSKRFENRVSENIAEGLFRKDLLSAVSRVYQSSLTLEEIAKHARDTRARVEAIERVVVSTHVERKEEEKREALNDAMNTLTALETAAELNALVEKHTQGRV